MSAGDSISYKDLREYIDAVDRLGELRIVNGANWDLEVGAITEVAARAARPKVVLFDNITGCPTGFRVVTNAICSPATTSLAFGLDPTLRGMDIIRAWKEKLQSYKPLKPLDVAAGPVTFSWPAARRLYLWWRPEPRKISARTWFFRKSPSRGTGGEVTSGRITSARTVTFMPFSATQARLFGTTAARFSRTKFAPTRTC